MSDAGKFDKHDVVYAWIPDLQEAEDNGDAMVEIKMKPDEGYAPLYLRSAVEAHITKHAQIGGTVFHPGIAVQTVIDRAYREYEYQQKPPFEAARIAKLKEFVESMQPCTCSSERDKQLCQRKDRCAEVATLASPSSASSATKASERIGLTEDELKDLAENGTSTYPAEHDR